VEIVEEDPRTPTMKTVDFAEEDPKTPTMKTVDFVEEDPKTPTMKTINVANAYDWQQRAHDTEQELSIAYIRLERGKRKTQRLECQINEYIEALARSTQDCSMVMNQCQIVSNTNLGLSRELQKAKLMIETLEAVIVLLYKTSKERDGPSEQQGPKEG